MLVGVSSSKHPQGFQQGHEKCKNSSIPYPQLKCIHHLKDVLQNPDLLIDIPVVPWLNAIHTGTWPKNGCGRIETMYKHLVLP